MRRLCPLLPAICLAVGALSPIRAAAQSPGQQGPPPPSLEAGEEDVRRKYPGWILFRPKKQTPSEQMQAARDLLESGRRRRAARALNALVHEWHASPEAPKAQMLLAETLYERGKLQKSFEEFRYLIKYYGGQVNHEQVIEYQFTIARRMIEKRRMTLGFFPGFRSPDKALPLLEEIVLNAPSWSRAAQAQFMVGMIYEEQGDLEEAIDAYDVVRQLYRKSLFAEESSYRRAVCLSRLSEKSKYDEQLCRLARAAFGRFLKEYPESEFVPDGKKAYRAIEARLATMYFERGVFYDRKERDPNAAIIAYNDFVKRFPGARQVEEAEKRITALQTELETADEDN